MNHQASHSPLPVNVAVLLLGIFYLTTSYAFYNLNHYKLLVALCGGLLLLALLWGGDALSRTQPARLDSRHIPPLFLLACLLPLLTTLPGLAVTGGRYNYFLAQEAALWLICCGWMLLLMRLLDNPQKLTLFLISLAMIVATIALVALWSAFGQYVDPRGIPINRESGTFGNPNFLACFLAMHIPLFGLCAATSWQGKFHVNVIFMFAALVSLLALLFTQSRVAMAALAIILGGLAVVVSMCGTFPQPLRKAGGLLIAVPLLAAVIAAFVFPGFIQSLTSELRSTPESRLVPWRAAWASIQDSPWLGWGTGSSYALFFQYVDPASRLLWQERSYAHPHNELLEILQEGGVLGLVGYLLFMGVVVLTGLRLLRNRDLQREYKVIILGVGCALLVYHMAGMASVDTRMAVVRLGLFTLLALVFALNRSAMVQTGTAPVSHASESFAASAGGTRLSTYAVVLALLAVSALLLQQDLASRHRFVGIMQLSDAANKEQLLEDLRDDNPNVYALEQLVQAELASGDFDGAALTLETLDALIPHYSISGYFRAMSYLLQNKEQEAKAAALAYQQRDLYFPQNAYLLTRIAVMRKEPDLFLRQLELLLTPALIKNFNLTGIDAADVSVESSTDATSCAIDRRNGAMARFVLVINAQVLADTMDGIKAGFESADPAKSAIYQATVAARAGSLVCDGFSDTETRLLRDTLQHILISAAARAL